MSPRRNAVLCVALCTLATLAHSWGIPFPHYRPNPHVPQYDGTTYNGFATYYGTPPMPGYPRVHCHMPNIGSNGYGPHIAKTIAMNRDQWSNSEVCGMCVEVWGPGKICHHGHQTPDCGMGEHHLAPREKFLAVVTDELFERPFGDIDIGEHGWGHYPVSWKPVPCPWNDHVNAKIVLHPGASGHYLKVQLRFGNSPMDKAYIAQPGKYWEESHWRFHDNFFIFQRHGGPGWEWDSNGQMEFRFITIFGSHYCGKIDSNLYSEPYEYNAWRC